MDSDYKKYSLGKLEEWMHDTISCAEATPQEIYDVIKKVVEENYYIYKDYTSRCYELLALLNGNGKYQIAIDPRGNKVKVCDKDDTSPECQGAWNDFWEEYYYPEEYSEGKVKKWQLPVEVDGLTGDCFVNFPDDLLEAANLKEGDQIEWIDQGDGSYRLKKHIKGLPSHKKLMKDGYKSYEEAVADGWTMTADGFWIKE